MGSLPSSAPPLPRLVWVSFWEGGGVSKFSVSARDCRALSEMSRISGSCKASLTENQQEKSRRCVWDPAAFDTHRGFGVFLVDICKEILFDASSCASELIRGGQYKEPWLLKYITNKK